MDKRFDGDELPDSTWGICKLHSPVGIVRLVGGNGQPEANGLCEQCWGEMVDEKYFSCPVHGVNPKAPGKNGCPVLDCLGKSLGPTEDEIGREAESIGSVWPGGALRRKDVLDEEKAGPPIERDREAVESAPGEARKTSRPDGSGVVNGPAWRDPFLIGEAE